MLAPLGVLLTAGMLVACQGVLAPSAAPAITVYKSPTCGCCAAWADHLASNGFEVRVVDEPRMNPLKGSLGVPEAMRSCHTATLGNYVIEGHVPAADIHRLLAEQPDIDGLAVPGMPIGSPGMEQGDRVDSYTVFAFDASGQRAFAHHGSAREATPPDG